MASVDEGLSEHDSNIPRWVLDSEVTACTHCSVEFGIFTRRHHCRNCRTIFCSKCVEQVTRLPPKFGSAQMAQVCGKCYNSLTSCKRSDWKQELLERVEVVRKMILEQAEIKQGDEWNFWQRKNDVNIWTKALPGLDVHCVRGNGLVRGCIDDIVHILHDSSNQKKMDPNITLVELLETVSDVQVLHVIVSAGLAADREVYSCKDITKVNDTTTVVTVFSLPYPNGTIGKGRVESWIHMSGYVLRDTGNEGETDVTIVLQVDPSGWVPKPILNLVARGRALVIDGIRKLLAESKKIEDTA